MNNYLTWPLVCSKGFLLVSTLIPLLGCQPEEYSSLPPFDGERAFAEVVDLVGFSPRDAGTPEGWKAAHHISERLEQFGIESEVDTFVDMTPEGEKTFRNVIGQIPGTSGQWIILGSHFDTMPGIENFQGANDSGSSTGVLLELARQLSAAKVTPETGILFAFFDGEEGIAGYGPNDGLHGSRRLAAQLVLAGRKDSIKAMVLLDMVGDPDLHFIIPHNSSPNMVKEVLEAAHATGHRNLFSLSQGGGVIDDHVPFLKAGIPAIDIIDFRYGSAPGLNDYWHTENDSLENIRADSLKTVGEIVLQLLKQMAFSANAE